MMMPLNQQKGYVPFHFIIFANRGILGFRKTKSYSCASYLPPKEATVRWLK